MYYAFFIIGATTKEVYAPEDSSERFLEFISGLGDLVTESQLFGEDNNTEAYRIEWKDTMTCIQFHINTLIQYQRIPQTNSIIQTINYYKIKELLTKNKIMIVWNESGRELNIPKMEDNIYFVIKPLNTYWCRITIIDSNRKLKKCGLILTEGIISDADMAKVVLRMCLIASMKLRKNKSGNAKVFISDLIKRYVTLAEIKKSATSKKQH